DLLANDVTVMAAEARLLAPQPLEFLPGSLGPPALEPLALEVVFLPHRLDAGAGVGLALAVGGQVDDPQIDSQEIVHSHRLAIGAFHGQIEQPLALAAEQIGLSLGVAHALCLKGTDLHRDGQPAGEGPEVDLLRAEEAHDPGIVSDGGIAAEDGPDGL